MWRDNIIHLLVLCPATSAAQPPQTTICFSLFEIKIKFKDEFINQVILYLQMTFSLNILFNNSVMQSSYTHIKANLTLEHGDMFAYFKRKPCLNVNLVQSHVSL